VAGQASGGQTLTPTFDASNSPAGFGGDLWGAHGGGITPVGGGVAGLNGYSRPVAITASQGATAANYERSPIPVTNKGAPTTAVLSDYSRASLSGQTADSALAAGGSNQG
jgi:hypothetical protein